ncbi:flagellar basal body L-ring protein FlgH [Simkania negevensis]|uniref:Flagellar basal body L-ring protein FlgH n=1 Tax=Simkania negevensis TaxID=83561 RepID=A0ABS3ASR7_9BACT|nr:flagellar basal body L-ring protein FlgH [Simkania negevensis]
MKGIKAIALGIALSLSFAAVEASYGGRLYQIETSPFAANVAHKVGDLLTIVVNEQVSTTNTGKNDITKQDELTWTIKKLFFPHFKIKNGFDDTMGTGTTPGVGFDSKDKFSSSASIASDHTFQTKLQVRITEKVSDDLFVIRGGRHVNINGKKKELFISGTIRKTDIDDDNTIDSSLIADAFVEIDDEVIVRDLEPGWFSKILRSIFF